MIIKTTNWNIPFLYDRCCHRTPVKYECDLKDLTYTFAKAEITHKNGALVTSILGMPGVVAVCHVEAT